MAASCMGMFSAAPAAFGRVVRVVLSGPSGDIPAGARIQWQADAPVGLQYQFWVRPAGSPERVIQPFSSRGRVTWTVAAGRTTIGVTVRRPGAPPIGSGERVAYGMLVQARGTAKTMVVDTRMPLDVRTGTVKRVWLENPVGEWTTLGPFASVFRGWTPRYPGAYELVAMTRANHAPNGMATAVRRKISVRTVGGALVALGDSISFGWDLGNNWNPSPNAFPYLLGRAEHLPVDDLGYPGWTTANLLAALKTARYTHTLSTAKLVTIDIGSNNLLQAAGAYGLLGPAAPPTAVGLAGMVGAISTMARQLREIVADVHREAPHARIVLYNLYDPLPPSPAAPNQDARAVVRLANQAIFRVARASHVPLANVYAAFNGQQRVDVQPGNFHPTVHGQEVLATVGAKVLADAAGRAP